jgi:repressor LexA
MNDHPANSNRPATTGGGSAYTPKQGQYLAFIYYYTKINGVPPAERDMQQYFRTSPPSVHQMVVTLEKRRLLERVPGQGPSIRLLVTRQDIPDLE